jgi:hypothetical protein
MLLSALSGCIFETDTGGDDDACASDGDCAAGDVCEFDACRRGCRSDVDCGAGQVCRTLIAECRTCQPGLQHCPCGGGGACSGVLQCCGGTCEFECNGVNCGDGICSAGEVCDFDCGPAGAACGDGLCEPGAESCQTCQSDCGPCGGPGPNCPPVMAQIFPVAPPSFDCNPIDQNVARIMSGLNAFWQSGVNACVCGPDAPALCRNNAIAAINRPTDVGYIWYDPAVLNLLVQQAGTELGPAWLIAHEFGHNIQNFAGTHPAGSTVSSELGADCLAGYFIGGLICTGLASQAEVVATLRTVCDLANMTWFDTSHGSCADRVGWIQTGISGYFNGVLPLAQCTF